MTKGNDKSKHTTKGAKNGIINCTRTYTDFGSHFLGTGGGEKKKGLGVLGSCKELGGKGWGRKKSLACLYEKKSGNPTKSHEKPPQIPIDEKKNK